MTSRQTTFRQLWSSLLSLYDAREAQAIVRTVLAGRFGMTLTDIACGGAGKLPARQAEELSALMMRLRAGEPVQYVLGEAWFCSRRFHVAPSVLIPRRETEELCQMITAKAEVKTRSPEPVARSPKLKILDIGTGSGCIAITLALDLPRAEVSATDVSREALAMARANAERLGAEVSFYRHDILGSSPLPGASGPHGPFSVIVSNPPYVTQSERRDMLPNVVGHEPGLALFVPDDDPLLFYRAIARHAVSSLMPGGSLYLEINPLFAGSLKTMLAQSGFRDIEVIDDQFGRQRFVKALISK